MSHETPRKRIIRSMEEAMKSWFGRVTLVLAVMMLAGFPLSGPPKVSAAGGVVIPMDVTILSPRAGDQYAPGMEMHIQVVFRPCLGGQTVSLFLVRNGVEEREVTTPQIYYFNDGTPKEIVWVPGQGDVGDNLAIRAKVSADCLAQIYPGYGYSYYGEATSGVFRVASPSDVAARVQLVPGWNLVGFPVKNPVPVQNVSCANFVWSWEQDHYVRAQEGAFERGRGYFVYARQACEYPILAQDFSVQPNLSLLTDDWSLLGGVSGNIQALFPGATAGYIWSVVGNEFVEVSNVSPTQGLFLQMGDASRYQLRARSNGSRSVVDKSSQYTIRGTAADVLSFNGGCQEGETTTFLFVKTDVWYQHPYLENGSNLPSEATIHKDCSWEVQSILREPLPSQILLVLVRDSCAIPASERGFSFDKLTHVLNACDGGILARAGPLDYKEVLTRQN